MATRHPRRGPVEQAQAVVPPDPGGSAPSLGREFKAYLQANPTHRFLAGLLGVVVGADEALDRHAAQLQDQFLAEKALRDLAVLGAQADSLLSHPAILSSSP